MYILPLCLDFCLKNLMKQLVPSEISELPMENADMQIHNISFFNTDHVCLVTDQKMACRGGKCCSRNCKYNIYRNNARGTKHNTVEGRS